MYVKVFNKILDSSIADNRRLRHFFIDLLLCADADGNVLMTKTAIAFRIRCDISEVEWGLAELMKPEPGSGTQEYEGRRIIPLEGHGYGWKIVNYSVYRDYKNSRDLREATAERVRRYRSKVRSGEIVEVKSKPVKLKKKTVSSGTPLPGEMAYVRQVESGTDKDPDCPI